MIPVTCGDYARVLFTFAREAAGALGTRHSLRPLFFWANVSCKTSGASRRENAGSYVKFESRHCEERSDEAIHLSSFRDGPKDQTRNLEIPGSMLRIAPE